MHPDGEGGQQDPAGSLSHSAHSRNLGTSAGSREDCLGCGEMVALAPVTEGGPGPRERLLPNLTPDAAILNLEVSH